MSFLNPNLPNPAAGGRLGALQFAGNGVDSCNCDVPDKTHYHNFEPRLGLAYSMNNKTVIRAGFNLNFAHGAAGIERKVRRQRFGGRSEPTGIQRSRRLLQPRRRAARILLGPGRSSIHAAAIHQSWLWRRLHDYKSHWGHQHSVRQPQSGGEASVLHELELRRSARTDEQPDDGSRLFGQRRPFPGA